jgi:hypothetical protein
LVAANVARRAIFHVRVNGPFLFCWNQIVHGIESAVQSADLGTGGYETVQLRSAAAEFLQKGEEERLMKWYFCDTALEILFHALVGNIDPIREHRNPIHSLSVPTPTVASRAVVLDIVCVDRPGAYIRKIVGGDYYFIEGNIASLLHFILLMPFSRSEKLHYNTLYILVCRQKHHLCLFSLTLRHSLGT